MYNPNEDNLKSFIAQYQQRIFALVLYLVGQDQDRAYDICSSSFAEVLRGSTSLEQKEAFCSRLVCVAVEKCRDVKTMPTFDVIDLLTISREEKEPLRLVLKALQALDFEPKALLLLRFQLNLFYGDIGKAMRTSESQARIRTAQARIQLEEEIGRSLGNT